MKVSLGYLWLIQKVPYTLDGALKKNPSSEGTRNLLIHRNNTIMYDLADAMFMAAYQQHFDDVVVQ